MRAKDFRREAWSKLNGRWGTVVLIALLVTLISGGLGALSIIGIGAVALLLVSGPLTLGLTIVSLKVIRGNTIETGDMFLGFKNFFNAFLLALLNEIFVFLWSLLFFIPGIIKTYSYSMSYYILADNPDMDGNTARQRSIEMMKGHKWRLFCLDFSFIGWGILCVLTFGILSFWVQPYEQCAHAAFYQELLREQSAMNSQPPAQPFEEAAPSEAAPSDTENSQASLDQPNGDEENK